MKLSLWVSVEVKEISSHFYYFGKVKISCSYHFTNFGQVTIAIFHQLWAIQMSAYIGKQESFIFLFCKISQIILLQGKANSIISWWFHKCFLQDAYLSKWPQEWFSCIGLTVLIIFYSDISILFHYKSWRSHFCSVQIICFPLQ